ncbi:MAG: hypothetical protein ING71_14835 [Rhodocyclaceae bacterium]|nr:hypothetical protein [Rhodocyclaceae bacterium]MCA3039124.1 hypothetical protein [Rhodocyclaceae bacterium]MCA3042953.1 hypothetical protein [Rhodocyclaceae bacterium]MCA3054283.1 hypothetical protein [Rhodocyclaceae bacterium]MCA3080054.1 hypothetical protein [Rhodocyclaceae bacterium]
MPQATHTRGSSVLFVILACVAAAAGCSSQPVNRVPTAIFDARVEQLLLSLQKDPAPNATDHQRAQSVRAKLASQVPEISLARYRELSDAQLRGAFELMVAAHFWTRESREFQFIETVYSEMDMRRILSRPIRRAYFRAAVLSRRFDIIERLDVDVADLKQRIPVLLPAGNWSPNKPSVLEVLDAGRSVKRLNVDFRKELQVLAIVHPQCHFSVAALEAIERDSSLLEALRPMTHWLLPQDDSIPSEIVHSRNSRIQGATLRIIFTSEHFPSLNTSSTPTFYVLKRGRVVESLIGWAPERDNVGALRAMVSRMSE